MPVPSKGWCLNPKGLFSGILYHLFGTFWRVQVYVCFFLATPGPFAEEAYYQLFEEEANLLVAPWVAKAGC